MDAKSAMGWAPFAARSLMFIITALRAACQRLIAFGTSVFLTSMSMFITASLSCPKFTAEASSPKGSGIFGIWSKHSRISSMILLSPSSLAELKLGTSTGNIRSWMS